MIQSTSRLIGCTAILVVVQYPRIVYTNVHGVFCKAHPARPCACLLENVVDPRRRLAIIGPRMRVGYTDAPGQPHGGTPT
jgi:hypothetical protein